MLLHGPPPIGDYAPTAAPAQQRVARMFDAAIHVTEIPCGGEKINEGSGSGARFRRRTSASQNATGRGALHAHAQGAVYLLAPVPQPGGGAPGHWAVHRALQHRAAHRKHRVDRGPRAVTPLVHANSKLVQVRRRRRRLRELAATAWAPAPTSA